MPPDSVLAVCVLLVGGLGLLAVALPYHRAAEEKHLLPILETCCILRGRSAFAMTIRGAPLYRISFYEDFMVIGMIGIFGALGHYLIPYERILDVKAQPSRLPLSTGVQINWRDGHGASFVWVLSLRSESIVRIIKSKNSHLR